MTLTVLLCLLGSSLSTPTITEGRLSGHTRFLASDELMGRGPATPGDALTQAYVATQFEIAGLKPALAHGSFLQPFQLVSVSGHPEFVTARKGRQKLQLKYSEHFMAVAGGHAPVSFWKDAELVFVGYGIVADEFQWNDYKGRDLRGKVLVMLNNDPSSDEKLFGGAARLWYGRWDYKYEMAEKVGAAGALIVHTTPSAGYPWKVVQTSWSGPQFSLTKDAERKLAIRAWATEDAVRRLVAMAGQDWSALKQKAESRDFEPVPLGVTVSTSFKNVVQKKQTANVLGVLPGSDEKLKNEWVVLTAHHDHLGMRENAKPGEDAIYNGAVDNATGVAALLAMAEAMRQAPQAPARSILFAAVAAEEQGLLGSEYLVENSPVPLGRLAANLNIDGLNVFGKTSDLTVIGLGKSTLDALIFQVALQLGRKVKPDSMPDRGFFYRSDQFNFAKQGVPAIYFGSGVDFVGHEPGFGKKRREEWEATHYHQVSDEVTSAWNWSGAVEDVEFYFRLAVLVANAPSMPQWKKGDEFEAARQKALQSLRQATGD